MKVIKLSLLLLILSLGISCDKDEEPTITLSQDLQNGFWEEEPEPNEPIRILKFDGTTIIVKGACTDGIIAIGCVQSAPPCIYGSTSIDYLLEGNIMTFLDSSQTDPITIVIQNDILTMKSGGEVIILERKPTLGYPDC